MLGKCVGDGNGSRKFEAGLWPPLPWWERAGVRGKAAGRRIRKKKFAAGAVLASNPVDCSMYGAANGAAVTLVLRYTEGRASGAANLIGITRSGEI